MPRTRLYPSIDAPPVDIAENSGCPDSGAPPNVMRAKDDAVKPARGRLNGLLDTFAAFPEDFMTAGRGDLEHSER
ncbi:AbrB family transcriptional regulator [Cupriavidus necator]|nr:AbrB family transcriptional regulator [Cupriavidus necator]